MLTIMPPNQPFRRTLRDKTTQRPVNSNVIWK